MESDRSQRVDIIQIDMDCFATCKYQPLMSDIEMAKGGCSPIFRTFHNSIHKFHPFIHF